MSQATESPGAVPTTATTSAPDVSRQIADLTDAVNRLVQAQRQQRAPQAPSAPVAPVASDISGAIPGGSAPTATIDVSKLSPLQQIALGLRDAKPVGPAHPAVAHAQAQCAEHDVDDAPSGAD